jgi:hypothetical protein
MEAARTSETSVDDYFTRQYIPEDKSELASGGFGIGFITILCKIFVSMNFFGAGVAQSV